MYLVDTNVWLERLLDQVKSEEVGKFIAHIPSERLSITDFTFHSTIVSFDGDFDRTERGKKTPGEILAT